MIKLLHKIAILVNSAIEGRILFQLRNTDALTHFSNKHKFQIVEVTVFALVKYYRTLNLMAFLKHSLCQFIATLFMLRFNRFSEMKNRYK